MSDTVKIIIEIPKYEYEEVKKYVAEGIFDYNSTTATVFKAVSDGTPLPEGHGRLIDADRFLKCIVGERGE